MTSSKAMQGRKPRVAVLGVQVPFTRGGAEILCDKLVSELKRAGYPTDLVTVPYTNHDKTGMLKSIKSWQELNLSSIDIVIATKFPSYFASHPNKSLWLVHQHRQMYELLGTQYSDFIVDDESEAIRRRMITMDIEAIESCRVKTTISQNVTYRLKKFLDIDSQPILPPLPLGDRYHCASKGEYILSVGRLCSIKRTALLIAAFPYIPAPLRLKIVGVSDEPGYQDHIDALIKAHNLSSRVDLMGRVSDDDLLKLYANAHSVFYGPFDEDYGFVTLEALMSSKPVVSCVDSGGVLAFVKDRQNGLVAEPTAASVASAFRELATDSALYNKLSHNSKLGLNIPSWNEVIDKLVNV
jgi:glycosyltransferase involved in cell wall biosynthesis